MPRAPRRHRNLRAAPLSYSTPGHRRKERDLVARLHRVIPADIFVIDGHPHEDGVLERIGEAGAAAPEPFEERCHIRHAGGELHRLFGAADFRTQPGEIKELHDVLPLHSYDLAPCISTGYCARKPPSTASTCPVTSAEARLAR